MNIHTKQDEIFWLNHTIKSIEKAYTSLSEASYVHLYRTNKVAKGLEDEITKLRELKTKLINNILEMEEKHDEKPTF